MSLPAKDTLFPVFVGSIEYALHCQSNKSDTAEHTVKNTSHTNVKKFTDFSFTWCPNNSYTWGEIRSMNSWSLKYTTGGSLHSVPLLAPILSLPIYKEGGLIILSLSKCFFSHSPSSIYLFSQWAGKSWWRRRSHCWASGVATRNFGLKILVIISSLNMGGKHQEAAHAFEHYNCSLQALKPIATLLLLTCSGCFF